MHPLTLTRYVALGLALGAATPAAAQTDPMPDPKACAPGERLRAGVEGPRAPTVGSGEHLSDKLARTDGVICPPAGVDTEIRAPTPDAGRTPVIPPPGTPGGDPSIQPK
jgi:hypothetical protein